jgi:hypothetical protein
MRVGAKDSFDPLSSCPFSEIAFGDCERNNLSLFFFHPLLKAAEGSEIIFLKTVLWFWPCGKR